MPEVGRVVIAMATGALENGVVRRIRVACRAHTIRIAVRDGERRVLRMVEGCTRPGCSRVAVLAGLREKLRLSGVAGIRRVLVIGLVATVARRW